TVNRHFKTLVLQVTGIDEFGAIPGRSRGGNIQDLVDRIGVVIACVEADTAPEEAHLETDLLAVRSFGPQRFVVLDRRQREEYTGGSTCDEGIGLVIHILDAAPGGIITDCSVVGTELTRRYPGDILQLLVELPAAGNSIVVVGVGIDGKSGRPVPAEASVEAKEIAIGQRSAGEIAVDGLGRIVFSGCRDGAYRVGDRIETGDDQAARRGLIDRADDVPAHIDA